VRGFFQRFGYVHAMLRFVYALEKNEALDAGSLRVEEFDAFEAADGADHGVAVAGRRCDDLPACARAIESGARWAVYRPVAGWREVVSQLNALPGAGLLLIEPWTLCATPRELWLFWESLTRPNVRLAWPAEWGVKTGQTPAGVIPVLNLRLGAVRVTDGQAATIDFAKRLAGIGFDGYFIVDPPASEDRLGEARKIVEIVRDIIQPRKPVKAVAKKA